MLGIYGTLKGRFTIFAIVLVIIAAIAAEITQSNTNKSNDIVADNLANRYELQNYSQMIHARLFDSYKKLSSFLLDPSRTQLKSEIKSKIEAAIQASQRLLSIDLANAPTATISEIRNLSILLKSLLKIFGEVINTRTNSLEQYPSLGLANTYLRPNRIIFVNSIALALNEIEESESEPQNQKIYKLFVKTRQLWMQMLSTFRLYLANRLGSFDEAALSLQENGIEETYEVLLKQLDIIKKLDQRELLGFETSIAFQDMQESLTAWYEGFINIKKVHQSGKWRTDVELLKVKIEPRLALISDILDNLNNFYEKNHQHNLTELRDATIKQNEYMWFVFSSIVIFFIITIFYFETLILQPIKVVSKAMKAVAYGETGITFPMVNAKETQGLMDAFNQMRAQVRSRQFELEHQSLHDDLTGLANRTLLRDRLSQAVYSARQSNTECALLILNVDRFKDINESLGHNMGDSLLIEVGRRIENELKEIDTIARLGGDEFAILLPHSNEEYACQIIKKIECILTSILAIKSIPIYVSGTVGVAIFPVHGDSASSLLKHADVALHKSKTSQQNFLFYSENDSSVLADRLTLSNDLRDALNRDLLYLEYQPQVDFKLGTVVEVEALIRWRHPELGEITADQIISVAEQTGQINSITHWVIKKVSEQVSKWRQEDYEFDVAINLSVLNLEDVRLIDEIEKCLTRYNLACHYFTFEITESAMMIDPIAAMKTLKKLESMGLKLVIDDFGTGYSSLSYLKELPVKKIKLDKSFVMSLDTDNDNEVIVRSTIELAHNLGLQVVAEGVENNESWEILKKLNCDFAQGFYLSKSKSADDLVDWIELRNLEATNCNAMID